MTITYQRHIPWYLSVLGHLETRIRHCPGNRAIGGDHPRPGLPDRWCGAYGHRSRGNRRDSVHHLRAISNDPGAILKPLLIPFMGKNIQPLLYLVRGKSGVVYWPGRTQDLRFGHLPGKIFGRKYTCMDGSGRALHTSI